MAKIELIDFYADWCGPCRVMLPAIESLMNEHNSDGSNVEIKKANVDQEPDLTAKYSIKSIPTLIFVKDGVEADRLSGVQSKDSISKKINELLALKS